MVANDQAARENDCSQARSQLAQQQNTPLGLLLGGTAFVLILLVTLLALASIERNERAMSRLLAEKGSSLIMAFESMLRTSMRGEARVRLQILLKEMASTSDVQFIAVTMPDGTILAHSNGNRLGEILRINGEEADEKTMKLLAPGSQTRSAILNMEGQRVFVVYRYFMQPPAGAGAAAGPAAAHHLPGPRPLTVRDHPRPGQGPRLHAGRGGHAGGPGLSAGPVLRAARPRIPPAASAGPKARSAAWKKRSAARKSWPPWARWAARGGPRDPQPAQFHQGYATYFGMRFPGRHEDRKAAASWCARWNASTASSASSRGSRRPSDVASVAAP